MNEELDLLIENFDQLNLENIEEYQVLMNTAGGPNKAESSSKQEILDPDESYAPIYIKPYKQYYKKIRNRQPPRGNKYSNKFELNDNYDKPVIMEEQN